MLWTSIPHAYEYWLSCKRMADPPSDMEHAERFVLDAHPRTAQDAACILDIVCANGDDVRADGLDRAALGRVRSFLLAID